jgi:hypothetical protein
MNRYIQLDHKTGDITIVTYDTVDTTIDGTVRVTVHLRGSYEYERRIVPRHRNPYYNPPMVFVEYNERVSFDVEFECRKTVGTVRVVEFNPVTSLDSFIDACSSNRDFPEDDSSHNPLQIAIDLKQRISRQPATSHAVNTSGSFDIWLENILDDGDVSYGVRDLKLRIAKHCDRFIRSTLPRYMK